MTTVFDRYEGKPAQFAFSAKDNRGRPGSFDYYRADNGMLFLDAVPADLGDFYEGGFQPIPANAAELANVAEAERFKIDQLTRYVSGGRYLEIGPWIGMAAFCAKTAGFDVTTLEMNETCVALMRSAGINAIQTDDPAKTLQAGTERYDAIALWHSIEHVPAPWTLLEILSERLRPGGVLLVATPNPDSAQARLFGRSWFHLDAPRHLHLLPVSMVQEIGERHGLVTLEVTTDDKLGVLLDRQGWEWPLWKHVPSHRRKGRLLVTPIVALRVVMTRLFRRKRNDGAAYTIVMKRPE